MATATATTINANDIEVGDELSFNYKDAQGNQSHRADYWVEEVQTGSENSYAVCVNEAGEYRRFRLDRMSSVTKTN